MVGKMKNSEVSKKGRVQYKGAGPRVPAYQQFSSSDSEQSDEDDYSEASSYETSVSPEPTPVCRHIHTYIHTYYILTCKLIRTHVYIYNYYI